MNEEHFRRLERMYASAPINEFFLPKLKVGYRVTELTMTARRDLFHAAEAVHGSVYFKALDDAAWFAANSVIEDVFVMTASFHLHLLRPVATGEMKAIGRLVHQTRRLLIAEAELTDDQGRLLARGNGSFMRTDIGLTPENGYV